MFCLKLVGPWMQHGGGVFNNVSTEKVIDLKSENEDDAIKEASQVCKKHFEQCRGSHLYNIKLMQVNKVVDLKKEFDKYRKA